MKKLFMVTLAAVLIISAAGCAKETAQQENPASPVQEEAISAGNPGGTGRLAGKRHPHHAEPERRIRRLGNKLAR